MKAKTTLVIPDVQYPFHDELALKKLIKVASDHQPDQIVQIGDGIDFPTVSRWAKDTALEYEQSLQDHIDGFREDVLVPFREAAPAADLVWLEGNHDLRVKDFIKKSAAPLDPLRALDMPNLFELDEIDWRYKRGPLRIATNVLAVHGHESGGYCASASAWDAKFAKRYGSEHSVIFGHTHQPFLISGARGFAGNVKPRFTMNVGSIMDPNDATYVRDGAVNWTMSFGWLEDNGKEVWPELILMNRRQFYFRGGKY